MRRWLAMGAMSLAMLAHAADEADLSTRSRTLAASKSLDAPHAAAPFTLAQDPVERMPFTRASEAAVFSTPCVAQAFCYEAGQGRVFYYRGAREYMPRLQGLSAEGVALRHDRLILRYSFR